MEPVQGRPLHVIRAPVGRVINTITVSSILSSAAKVRRYQVRQTSPRDLTILVVPSSTWVDGGSEVAVRNRFLERLGHAFNYEIVRVADLPLAPSGKFQTIVPLDSPKASPPTPESGKQSPSASADSS
jgi:hypothetical protein